MSLPARVIAVDWSGAIQGSTKKIWLAKVDRTGLSELENGRSRKALCARIIAELAHGPDVVVGLDFAFSFPSWFVEEKNCSSAFEFWQVAGVDGEGWLKKPPFFSRGGWRRRQDDAYRWTDRHQIEHGRRPETVFKLVGPTQVGRGSIRGMPWLLELRQAGFSIWPFEPPRLPLVVEIYPRLFYGGVNKSSPDARYQHLTRSYPNLEGLKLCKATDSDDAFDAAVSAYEMWKRRSGFTALPERLSKTVRLEGWIWDPDNEPPSGS